MTEEQQYIENLTNDFIGRNKFHLLRKDNFVDVVQSVLFAGDVRILSSDKVGKILCILDSELLIVEKQQLLTNLTYGGDCSLLLRDLLSRALAFVIEDRLRKEPRSVLRPYVRKGKVVGGKVGNQRA